MLSYWKICIFFGVFSCIVWETFQDCVFQGSRIDLLSPGLFRISQQFKKRQTALPVWIEVVGKVTVFSAFQGAWGGNCQGRSIFPNILKKGEGKCQGPAGFRCFQPVNPIPLFIILENRSPWGFYRNWEFSEILRADLHPPHTVFRQ